jgi:dienelactone hydrolase
MIARRSFFQVAVFAVVAIGGPILSPSEAEAGIVVLKNGKVVVGRVLEDKSTKEKLLMRPPNEEPGRGEFEVERFRIRWYSATSDRPTDAYWEEFKDAKIDNAWEPERQKWLLRQKNKLDVVPAPQMDLELLSTHTIQFPAADGLSVSADLYGGTTKDRPVIVLCHQARSSRGEYKSIAPRLLKAGFTCLALDQRSGEIMNKVTNLTAVRAKEQKKKKAYGDARQDIEAAVKWLRAEGYTGKLTLWGSSYSASLVMMIAAENTDVGAVIAFSPGDYLKPDGTVAKHSAKLATPLLVVAPEKERSQATALANGTASKHKQLAIDKTLMHGSRTLFHKEANTELAWTTVMEFLEAHCR